MGKISRLALISIITCGFITQSVPASARRTITCRSTNNRYNYCRANTRGGVRIRKQISQSSCREGRSWGYDREGIWVDRGCSAEFVLGRKGNGNNDYDYDNGRNDNTAAIVGGAIIIGAITAAIAGSDSGNSSGNTVKCESQSGRFNRCSVDLRRGDRVYLQRQLSNTGCWEGETWGYDRDGIWVDQGCRGEFSISRN